METDEVIKFLAHNKIQIGLLLTVILGMFFYKGARK